MNVSFTDDNAEYDDANDHHRHSVDKNDDVVIYRINGPFFFGVASTIMAVLDSIDPEPRAFILDLSAAPIADGSAAEALLSFAQKAQRKTRVYIIGANKGVRRTLFANDVDEHIVCFAPDEFSARHLISEETTCSGR